MMGVGSYVDYDFYHNRYLGAEMKFTWWPQKCNISGKKLWLQNAYRLTAMWRSDMDVVFEHRWHDKNEHIIWKLKQ